MEIKPIKFANLTIGTGYPTFVIAEIGYNFNTLEEGLKSIDSAVECGADAVKFQSFKAETVTSRAIDFPQEGGGGNQYEEFKKYELSEDHHRVLFQYAEKKKIVCFSSPSFYDDADFLDKLGVPLFKIGSDDLTNYPFVEYVAKKKKPIILSTGMATMQEISGAVDAVLSTGNEQLVLLQCVSNYPIINLKIVNLRAMVTLRESFGVLTGFSDHTTTLSVPVAATALGMSVYERHFTINKNLAAPDCAHSADPKEMKAIVKGIREVELALGDGIKRPSTTEIEMRRDARKSIIASRNLPAGTVLKSDDMIVKRPAWGIPPSFLEEVPGLTLSMDVKKDQPITWDHLKGLGKPNK